MPSLSLWSPMGDRQSVNDCNQQSVVQYNIIKHIQQDKSKDVFCVFKEGVLKKNYFKVEIRRIRKSKAHEKDRD